MATKTITSTRTLHLPGKDFRPFKFSELGLVTYGKYDVIEVAPKTPVEIESDEADMLIARGHAELYVAPEAPEVVAAPKK